MVLTLDGWDRFERLKKSNPTSATAFMKMRFGDPQMDAAYEHHFRPAIRALEFDLLTVNRNPEAGQIDTKIRLDIYASRFGIADLTHGNRGVYFEAGFVEGIGCPVIYTCRRDVFDEDRASDRPHP